MFWKNLRFLRNGPKLPNILDTPVPLLSHSNRPKEFAKFWSKSNTRGHSKIVQMIKIAQSGHTVAVTEFKVGTAHHFD